MKCKQCDDNATNSGSGLCKDCEDDLIKEHYEHQEELMQEVYADIIASQH